MVTLLSLALIMLPVSFVAGWVFASRYRPGKASDVDTPKLPGNDTKRQQEGEATPSLIVEYDDDMEIPAALIGARCKEIIEHFAPALGLTPVNLLRAAIAEGLTGGRPVTKEMLDVLDEEVKAMQLSPPSDPGSSQPS
jgi:hypothetical protein